MSMSNDYVSSASRNEASEQREGKIAKSIEKQTAKLPSDAFLWAAGATVVGSLVLQLIGTRRGLFDMTGRVPMMRAPLAAFVGQWAPTILLLGIYNKIVKVAGSDRTGR